MLIKSIKFYFLLLSIGLKNIDQNGFSQSASAQPPTGTWENGVYDYDHLKKSYIPTYTRYWDSQSKVPFLYNLSTNIWISYDDLQSIGIKADYIKREKLAGAMFWELSSDRNSELIDATYEVLNNDVRPSLDANPPIEITNQTVPMTTRKTVSTKAKKDKYPVWIEFKDYKFGEYISYDSKIYRCIVTHQSLPGWTPFAVRSLWKPL